MIIYTMDKNTTHTMGIRIKISRQKTGLSQSEVSKMMHLSRGVCGQWERGIANPSTAHLSKLAKILEVSFEYLATGDKPKIEMDFLDKESQIKILKAKMSTLFAKLPLSQQQNIVNFLQGVFTNK